MRLIHRNVDLIQAEGEQHLIYLGGTDGPDMVEGVGLIGAIEEFGRLVGAAIERLVLMEGEIHTQEAKTRLIGQIEINGYCILALVLRVLGGEKPVLVAVDWDGQNRLGLGLSDR